MLFLCDPTAFPSQFFLALLTYTSPQLKKTTGQSRIYCKFSYDFFFPFLLFFLRYCKFLDSREKWEGYFKCGTPVIQSGMTYALKTNTILLHVVYNGFQILSGRTQLMSVVYFCLISRFALALLTGYFSKGSSIY